MKIGLNNFIKEYYTIKEEIDSSIFSVICNGNYILGENVKSFEKNFSKYIGSKYCVGVASGTDAITLSLIANSIGIGDEVIVPDLTAYPTAVGILNSGATPIPSDIYDNNGLLNVEKIESIISEKTKAILPVHLYGHPCDMASLIKICDQNGLILIEDCAQAIGSEYKGLKVGNFGKCGAFSFYPTKNLGSYGDAGAIVTNDKKVYEKLISLRNYGQIGGYLHQVNGLNSRLDEIQAAILNVKLKYIDEWNDRRAVNANYYRENLKNELILDEDKLVKHTYHIFAIKSDKRKGLIHAMDNNHIETKIHYPTALSQNDTIKSVSSNYLSKSIKFAKKILSIPMNPWLEEKELSSIVSTINDFYDR